MSACGDDQRSRIGFEAEKLSFGCNALEMLRAEDTSNRLGGFCVPHQGWPKAEEP
jgi:hypothetical protein